MEVLSRAIPSPEYNFIDIDNLLGGPATGYRLSLPQDRVKEEAIETIDLTGIGKIGVAKSCAV